MSDVLNVHRCHIFQLLFYPPPQSPPRGLIKASTPTGQNELYMTPSIFTTPPRVQILSALRLWFDFLDCSFGSRKKSAFILTLQAVFPRYTLGISGLRKIEFTATIYNLNSRFFCGCRYLPAITNS